MKRVFVFISLFLMASLFAGGSFQRDPAGDDLALRKRFVDPELGFESFLRKSFKNSLQAYLDVLGPSALDQTPTVYLHGNPNLGNFAVSEWGCSLVDFDRARQGPYTWDIFRFLIDAASIYSDQNAEDVLLNHVVESFETGYLLGLRQGIATSAKSISDNEIEIPEGFVKSYAASNGKLIQKMRKMPLATDDPKLVALLQGYLESIARLDILATHSIVRAGQDQGIAVQNRARDRFLLHLQSHVDGVDDYIMGLKEVCEDNYSELDTSPWFNDPFSHHGERMAYADSIYSPVGIFPIGPTETNDAAYYGRIMFLYSVKYERMLTADELKDLAYTIGAHLGAGHSRSSKVSTTELERHFRNSFRTVLVPEAARIVNTAKDDYKTYILELWEKDLYPL